MKSEQINPEADSPTESSGVMPEAPETLRDGFRVGWWNAAIGANFWLGLTSVEPRDAAMLLCGFNPNNSNSDPLRGSTEETGPEDYKNLLKAFENIAAETPGRRNLCEWLEIAKSAEGVKYHSWIDKYLAARERTKDGKKAQPTSNSPATDDRGGITKDDVISAFEGIYFDEQQWRSALGKSIPAWLLTCRKMPGKKGHHTSATWNPVLIAAALFGETGKGIGIKKLDAVFVGLKDWQEEWQEESAKFR